MANLSQSGYNLIKQLEGYRLKSYHLKGEAYWTVGLGHYGPDVIPNKTYSEAEVNAFFNKDKQRFEADVNKVWTSDMPKGAFDALFSLAYNHGNVSKTAVGRAAKAGTWKDREKFTKLWLSSYTCKGLLTGRRRKEIAYFYSTDINNIPLSNPSPSTNNQTYA